MTDGLETLARSEVAVLLDQWAAWVINGGQSKAHPQALIQLDAGPARPAPVVENVLIRLMDYAVDQLPSVKRAMLCDYCVTGMTVKAIAEKYGMNQQTAKAQILCSIDKIGRDLELY